MLANATYTHEHDAIAAERPGSDGIIAVFKRGREMHPARSQKEGRAVYDEFDEIHFLIPGDKTYEHVSRVSEEHKRRFPRQWADYQAGREQINGEPLENWFQIAHHPGLIDEMRALKVRSVQDLANLNDDFANRNMGWAEWRDKARKYVAAQKAKEALAEQNAELLAQLKQMQERIDKMENEPKRGPGRPPKSEA